MPSIYVSISVCLSNINKHVCSYLAAVLPPVQPKTDTKSSEGRWDIMKELSSNVSTIVFAGLFVVSVVLMIVVVVHFTRKRKAEDRQFLIHSDWDN